MNIGLLRIQQLFRQMVTPVESSVTAVETELDTINPVSVNEYSAWGVGTPPGAAAFRTVLSMLGAFTGDVTKAAGGSTLTLGSLTKVTLAEQGSAPTAASGFAVLYVGTDKDLHIKDDAATDTPIVTTLTALADAITTLQGLYVSLNETVSEHGDQLDPGIGISGTFTPPLSITVVDGIITAIT